MKILDILSEASYFVDDGSRARNAQTMEDYLEYIRWAWLEARDNKGAEDEQDHVQKTIAKTRMYEPEPDTIAIGLWRKLANAKYAEKYHFDNDDWEKGAVDPNTLRSGNRSAATARQVELARQGGKTGIRNDRAGRERVRRLNAQEDGQNDIENQAKVLGMGNTPSKEVHWKQDTPRHGSQQHQLDKEQTMVTPEMQQKFRDRIAKDTGEVSARRAAYQEAKAAKKGKPAATVTEPTTGVKKKKGWGTTADGEPINNQTAARTRNKK